MRVTGEGGVGIEVAVDGPEDGTPVLFMHGWPDTHDLWRYQVKALTDAGYRTITPDLRGFGASDKPQETEGLSSFGLAKIERKAVVLPEVVDFIFERLNSPLLL